MSFQNSASNSLSSWPKPSPHFDWLRAPSSKHQFESMTQNARNDHRTSVKSRVCNVCHYSWNEVCSNNSPVVLRKETKDGPHVGRRYFQCTDRDCNERFFKWLDKGTRRYSTRNRFHFSHVQKSCKVYGHFTLEDRFLWETV